MSRSLIYKFTLFLMVSLGTSFSAQALECHLNTENGITEESEDIGQLKIPATLPVNSRLWTSKIMQRTVVCWAYPNVPEGEFVYFWVNPDDVPLAPGIGMGIIYNGRDLGVLRPIPSLADAPETDMYRYPMKPEAGVITYQVYLQKTGPIGEITTPEYAAFQLDGKLGINSKPGSNYRFIMTGLDKIEVLQCSASVELETPEGVDFGEIRSWTPGDGTVASKDFTIFIRKNGCDDDFNLDVNFMAKDATLTDTTGLNMANGSTLRIHDNTNPKAIKFNQFDSFANMTGRNEATKSYTASLEATGEAQEGPFKKTVVLLVNYL